MHQYATLEDTLYLHFASNDTSGSGGDGASALADVREGGSAADAIPTLSPSPALLTHANYPAGCYEVAVAATAANGFSADKTYAVFCTLAVDSQNPTGFIGSFRLSPVPADMTKLGGGAQSATDLKDFADAGYDPATNSVEQVKVNDDMVGTASALLASSAPTNFGSMSISAGGLVDILQTAADKVWGTTTRTITGLTTAAILAIWDQATSALTTAGKIGKLLVDNINATISSRYSGGNITGNLSGSVGSVTGAVGSVTGNVGGNVTGSIGSLAAQAKLDVNAEADTALTDYNPPTKAEMDTAHALLATAANLTALKAVADAIDTLTKAAGDGDLAAILTDTGATIPGLIAALNNVSVADLLTTQMTEAYAADGVAPTLAQALFAIQQGLLEFAIASLTITTKKLDKSTTAMTHTIDSATDPTSRTRES